MCEIDIKQNDVGIQFIITVTSDGSTIVDLSDCSNFTIIFVSPDKNRYTVSADLLNDGTDGKIYYISTSTDLTVTGRWKIQVSYTKSGNIRYTSIDTFLVTSNL